MNKKETNKLKEKEFVESKLDKETVKKIMTPMNDFVFKKLFGTLGKERLIKDFLEAILDIKIDTVELGLETILTADEIDEKAGILDVRVRLEDGTEIDVEIQNSINRAIIKRSHFYASRMYGKQLRAGIDYGDLKREMIKEIMEENEKIKEANEELERLQSDEHLQYLAWLREKYILETNTMKNEGREEGKKETRKEIVKKMVEENFDVSVISKITGLSIEEIEEIQSET